MQVTCSESLNKKTRLVENINTFEGILVRRDHVASHPLEVLNPVPMPLRIMMLKFGTLFAFFAVARGMPGPAEAPPQKPMPETLPPAQKQVPDVASVPPQKCRPPPFALSEEEWRAGVPRPLFADYYYSLWVEEYQRHCQQRQPRPQALGTQHANPPLGVMICVRCSHSAECADLFGLCDSVSLSRRRVVPSCCAHLLCHVASPVFPPEA